MNNPPIPGALPPLLNPGAPHYDTVFPVGAATLADSKDWASFMPPFRWQGWYPFCVAFGSTAINYALNLAGDNRRPILSPAWLFFRGGGSPYGSIVENLAAVERNVGVVYEADKPMPTLDAFSYSTWDKLQEYAENVPDAALAKAAENKLAGNSYVDPNNLPAVIDALAHSPIGIVVPVHHNYFDAMNGWTPSAKPELHYVVLRQQLADGTRRIFDSLTQKQGFDGFHDLPADYPVNFGMSYRDLPTGWQATQAQTIQQQYAAAYNHYGQPRLPLVQEQALATKLRTLVESYPDTGIRTIAGKYWIVLVNAALYGGYSYTVKGPDGRDYFAYGSHGSDLANALYQYRRTGKFPFDFNKLRSEQ